MEHSSNHFLSVILFTPLAGALLLLFVPRESQVLHRLLGNLFGVLGFLVSLPLMIHFPTGSGDYAFKETADWIPSIGAKYSLGADGISMLLVILTTLLGMIAITSSWSVIQQRTKEYYILLLLLQTGILGVFLSLDLFLFYIFWEVMLVPMYFLIGVWGSERRLYAAIKFFLYTLAGSVIMLLAILALYFNYTKTLPQGAIGTFNIPTLLAAAQQYPDGLKIWLFWGFFFAFAVKVPMFPFHTWLPDAHTEAPNAVSVILAGVLLKTGTYGFLRFSLPLLPADAALRAKIIHIVITLSLIGIIYGAVVCLMQKDIKRLIAYSSVSQLGFCTLGIFALSPQGLAGSVLQQVNHGISIGALFLIVGVLEERRHTRLISEFGGLATPMPNFAAIYLIVSLSSLGMPLLNGFIGEFTILQGVFVVSKAWAAWAALGIVLAAAYLLSLYQRTMFGPVTHEVNKSLPDLNLREYAVLLPLVAIAFWIGIYPKPFFAYIEKPVQRIVQQVNPGFYQANRQMPLSAPVAAPALEVK
ncbi:MAG TPA: NADH-quinone oxidoreductase subunit M [Candidatus Baltobacteraceae bacterium]|nr:NADH-quinone oxidoreductase subunit M [Candidatus Baltobacteraceae bacterium]